MDKKLIEVLQIADEKFLSDNPNIRKYMDRIRKLCSTFSNEEYKVKYSVVDWTRLQLPPAYSSATGRNLVVVTDWVRYTIMRDNCDDNRYTIYIDSDIEILDDNFLYKLLPMLKYNVGKLIVGGEPYGAIVRPVNGIMISSPTSRSILDRMKISAQNALYGNNPELVWGSNVFNNFNINELTILNSTLFFPEPYTKDGNHELTNKTNDTLGWHHYGYPKPDPIYE